MHAQKRTVRDSHHNWSPTVLQALSHLRSHALSTVSTTPAPRHRQEAQSADRLAPSKRNQRIAPAALQRAKPAQLPGRSWIAASRFNPRSQAETLTAIKEQVRLLADLARRTAVRPPVVVFDLDGTLLDNRFRTITILKEWVAATPDLPAQVRKAISTLHSSDVAYDLAGTFSRLGLSPDTVDSAGRFWKARFFSNAYLRYDRPHLGALAYVKALHDAGARTVYLTGRDEPGMGEGTREALRSGGFPMDASTQLILKDRFETPDAEFKAKALPAIRDSGRVVATFDNEPANVVVFAAGFPEASNVFVDTDYSDKPVAVTDGLSWIADFRIPPSPTT
jgi:hypothetical protein